MYALAGADPACLARSFPTLPLFRRRQELRRLHIHASTDPAGFVRFKCLSGLDVGILGNGWHEDICDVLKALPHTVTSVCVAGKHRAALCLGKDSSWQVGRAVLFSTGRQRRASAPCQGTLGWAGAARRRRMKAKSWEWVCSSAGAIVW